MKIITLKHDEQLLGESSKISFKIVFLPYQLACLVIQSNLVVLQTTDLLISCAESGLQSGVLLFKSSDGSQFFFSKLRFVQGLLLCLCKILILLLQSFFQFICSTSSEINIKNGQERK